MMNWFEVVDEGPQVYGFHDHGVFSWCNWMDAYIQVLIGTVFKVKFCIFYIKYVSAHLSMH